MRGRKSSFWKIGVFCLILNSLSLSSRAQTASLDNTFNTGLGASAEVSSLAVQADGKIVVAGDFTLFNSLPRNRVIRLNADGSVDLLFNVATGANGPVLDAAVQADGRIVLAGALTTFAGTPHQGIVRLDANGSVDASFNASASPNGVVKTVAIDASGRIIIGGEFTTVNGVSRPNIARLNADGSLDASFSAQATLNGPVHTLALQADGKILVGGDFTLANNTAHDGLARLNADGSVDASFEVGAGFDGPVESVEVQADGKVVVAGSFSMANGVSAQGLVRLNADGSVDAGFHPVLDGNGELLEVKISGDGDLLLAGQFNTLNGAAIKNVARLNVDGSLDASFHADAAVNGTVQALAIQADGKVIVGGEFSITGGVQKNIARLNVGGGGSAAPVIAIQPASQTAPVGANVLLLVAASSDTQVGYQWQKDGVSLTGQTSATLLLNNVQSVDAGGYSVVVSNSAGVVTSATAILTVGTSVAPIVVVPPVSQEVEVGANVTFAITATGTAPLSFQWRKDGVALEGKTSASLTLEAVAVADAGKYSVVVSNAVGVATSAEAILTVKPPGAPAITIQPISQTVNVGADVTFSVRAEGSAPLTFQWRKEGVAIEGATSVSLTLNAVATANAGGYSVTVSNAVGATTSATATLIVNPVGTPIIVVPPVSQTVHAGANVTFDVVATGALPLSFQWRKDGVNLNGQASASLTLNAVSMTDAGLYSVVISNRFGATVSADASLTVNPENAPVITVPPVSQTVNVGADVVFSVTAEGTAPLHFQWRKDGVNIEGATSASLSLHAVTSAEAGGYSVVVSNDFGVVTSAVASLTVSVPGNPVIVVQPISQTVNAGADVTFHVEATGSGQLSFQWLKDGANLTGETSASLTLDTVTSADVGNYSVVVSNNVGVAASAVARLNVITAGTAGSLDVTFQALGLVGVNDLELQADGQIVAGGSIGLLGGLLQNGLVRLNGNGSIDLSFQIGAGANEDVNAVELQADGKILVGGEFTTVNGTNQNHLARLNADGSLDAGFNTGTGPNDSVLDLAVQTDGKIVVSGAFTAVNGTNRPFVARLNADGSVDASFAAGTGPNAPVTTVSVQADGKILIGGEFSLVGGTNRQGIARLNADGSVDVSFAASLAGGASVQDIELQADGKILVGGKFMAGTGSGRNLIRLNADGSLDASLNAGAGPNDSVLALAVQSDGKILIGGEFTGVDGLARRFLARLNANGSVDASFDAGASLTAPVEAIELQADGKILVGGEFGIVRIDAEVRGPILFGSVKTETGFTLSLHTEAGKTYALEYTTSLSNQNWVQASTLVGDGRVKTMTDASASGAIRFYRIREE